MDHITITQLRQEAGTSIMSASLDAQLQSVSNRSTKGGSPYLEVVFADALSQFKLKIWENKPQFQLVKDLPEASFVRLSGDWTQSQYGVDGVRWDVRLLRDEEIEVFMIGDPQLSAKQAYDWETITTFLEKITDPRLASLADIFLSKYEQRFRRSAAARKNHHARRGGLVEHVAQMMRTAVAISKVYPKLNRDLLVVGVLFHDCGKMWENTYPEAGFHQPHDLEGEMLGHIPKGMEVCTELWNEMMCSTQADAWTGLFPLTEHVRIHLMHLIASHHGTHEFGSPTLPRTPEAWALHFVDNIDAKYEMLSQGYETARELAPGIYERQFPLPANLIEPLAHFPTTDAPPAEVVRTSEAEMVELEDELESKPFNGELF